MEIEDVQKVRAYGNMLRRKPQKHDTAAEKLDLVNNK